MQDAWDYIIVGGGSAGAVLASRLSEHDGLEVLLLEAGRNYRSEETPWQFTGRDSSLAMPPDPSDADQAEFASYFWTDIPARGNAAQAIRSYVRGKGVGGCSTVNGIIALRPAPEDFDAWVGMGAEGWSWGEVLPALVRLESDEDFPQAPYHGGSGPLPIHREPAEGWGGTDRALRSAAESMGYGVAEDVNAPDATGVGTFPLNLRDGRRVSTNDAYLEPARDRPNLRILGDSQVDRVVLDRTSMRATGVRLVDGREFTVRPGGEVLLSAGAVHSPAILMRSGIGPREHLQGLGIEPLVDLPVGQGAQDHAMLQVEYEADEAARVSDGGRHANVIVRYTSGMGGHGRNDMMFVANNHFATAGRPTRGGITVQLNAVDSRGTLTLRSSDPLDEPLLDLNLLGDGSDMERMMDGIERAKEIIGDGAFVGVTRSPLIFPKNEQEAREAVTDIWHLCSTARMGAADDSNTVVTPDCKVLGVGSLRVVDASVMPTVVRANIHLAVLAIAEKMADELTK